MIAVLLVALSVVTLLACVERAADLDARVRGERDAHLTTGGLRVLDEIGGR